MYKQLWSIGLFSCLVCLLATGCRSIELKKSSRRQQTQDHSTQTQESETHTQTNQDINTSGNTHIEENAVTGEIIFKPISPQRPAVFTNPSTGKKDTLINAEATFRNETKNKQENTQTIQTVNNTQTIQKSQKEETKIDTGQEITEINKNKETESPGPWAWILGAGTVLLLALWLDKFLTKKQNL